jgi:endonuclease-3
MGPEEILKILRKEYPNTRYYLNFSSPLELAVAAILSAQCRDEVVNATTKLLFRKYRTAGNWERLEDNDVKAITFYRAKAENIRKMAKMLDKKHNGKVPDTMEGLTDLPGIGKKTANAILLNAFGKVEGIVVDTHVIRIAYRLGWTNNKEPEKIEQDLMGIFPKKDWKSVPHLLKNHGRAVCRAPVPDCQRCVLEKYCPKKGVKK